MPHRTLEGEGRLKAALALAVAVLAIGFGACRTPSPPVVLPHVSQALPEGRDFYFFLSVPKNRAFLERFFRESGLASRGSDYLIANSRLMYGAASITSGREPGLVLVAEGDYSKSLVEFGIGLESGWDVVERKAGSGAFRAFREKASGFEIAIPNDRLMILATGSTAESLERIAVPAEGALPKGAAAEFEAHAAAAFLPAPAETVIGLASPEAPAFDRLYLFADAGSSSYDLSGRLSVRDERDGRVLASVLKLFLAEKMSQQGFGFEETRRRLGIEHRGTILAFSGFVFPESDLATLLGALLLKGKKGRIP